MKILEFFGTCGYVIKFLACELMQAGSSGSDDGEPGGWMSENVRRPAGDDDMPINYLPPAEHNGWGFLPDYSIAESDSFSSHDWSGGMDYGTGIGGGSDSWM